MESVTGTAEARALIRAARRRGQEIGLVPTMGALHEGHLSLVRAARVECGFVAVSLFVNPAQFGPGEDLDRYPRDFEGDRRAAAAAGADLLFAPSSGQVYAEGHSTYVTVEELTDRLEGAFRPGHFRGVTTVVAKLFNMLQPDRAYFGEKDYQQLQVIRRMTRDLDFPIEIAACPTVREPDGLAMSSRNRMLGQEARREAAALYRALAAARERFRAGERRRDALLQAARGELAAAPGIALDYLELADPETLAPAPEAVRSGVLLVAARAGGVRLIDNVLLAPESGSILA